MKHLVQPVRVLVRAILDDHSGGVDARRRGGGNSGSCADGKPRGAAARVASQPPLRRGHQRGAEELLQEGRPGVCRAEAAAARCPRATEGDDGGRRGGSVGRGGLGEEEEAQREEEQGS